jgi:hypothetical protein
VRRLLAGAAAGVALVLAAPQVGAQDSVPPNWAGSRSTTPAVTSSSSPHITARFIRAYNSQFPIREEFYAETTFTTPSGLPTGCPAAGTIEPDTAETPGDELSSTDTSAIGSAPCNGTYQYAVTGIVRNRFGGEDEAVVTGSIDVAAPPPDVTKVSGTFDAGSVQLTWTPLGAPPPDFLGYQVERGEADEWKPIARDLGPNAKAFTDSSPPSGAGAIYRVRARRAGPRGEVLSSGGATATVDLPGGGPDTTAPPGTDGGTSVPGTDGGAGGGADGGADGGDGDGGGGGRAPRSGPLARGRTGIGTKAPRLGTPSQANFPPLLTRDEGFEEEIDYGDGALAGEEDDELSSLFYEEDTGRGMAVPVATGFVLAAWAFHLRFLAKAARPGAPIPAGPGEREVLPEPAYDPYDPYDPYERYDKYDTFGP